MNPSKKSAASATLENSPNPLALLPFLGSPPTKSPGAAFAMRHVTHVFSSYVLIPWLSASKKRSLRSLMSYPSPTRLIPFFAAVFAAITFLNLAPQRAWAQG
jgi:hypothetical protein